MYAKISLGFRLKVGKPGLYFGAVLPQAYQEFLCSPVRVLADWVYFVASLEESYVAAQALPNLDPVGPEIIKSVRVAILPVVEHTGPQGFGAKLSWRNAWRLAPT